MGWSFLIHTDHYNLKFLLDQKLATIPQHQWVSNLLGFDFHVEYKPSIANVVANALSRRDLETEPSILALSVPSFELFEDLQHAFTSDLALRSLRDKVEWGGGHGDNWHITNGLVIIDGRVYIPVGSSSTDAVLHIAHDVDHEGVAKTLHQLQADFHLLGACTTI
jgi:hypothetical protein